MNFYKSEIERIRKICFSNEQQIQTVIGIKNFIENNFESDLNLDLLSHTSLVSKYHLIRLFKKYYGQTPRQYLIDIRIEESKKLLKKNITVTETCYRVGFESVGSFSTLFKNKIGKSPIEYQKAQFSRSD